MKRCILLSLLVTMAMNAMDAERHPYSVVEKLNRFALTFDRESNSLFSDQMNDELERTEESCECCDAENAIFCLACLWGISNLFWGVPCP